MMTLVACSSNKYDEAHALAIQKLKKKLSEAPHRQLYVYFHAELQP